MYAMSQNPWSGPVDYIAMASMLGAAKMYCDRLAEARERELLERAVDSWENEGGSGPAEIVFTPPSERWCGVLVTNGNGRWNAIGWHPYSDVLILIHACRESPDEKIREMAEGLESRWAFI
jgi:hypothetical protein